LGISLVGVLLIATLQPSVVYAEDDDRLPVVDEDFGRKLRHPPAVRKGDGWLRIGNSGRKSPDPGGDREPLRRSYRAEPQWQYHWFGHPKPSYQYFNQPRTYVWRYDSYPGLRPHLDPNNTPYYFYYYQPSPYYYYPPGGYWRYGTPGWYGW
jgi:hypothetical protein